MVALYFPVAVAALLSFHARVSYKALLTAIAVQVGNSIFLTMLKESGSFASVMPENFLIDTGALPIGIPLSLLIYRFRKR